MKLPSAIPILNLIVSTSLSRSIVAVRILCVSCVVPVFTVNFRGIGQKYLFRCFPHNNATPSFRRTAFLLSRVCADIV
jgi:hypothetical protein